MRRSSALLCLSMAYPALRVSNLAQSTHVREENPVQGCARNLSQTLIRHNRKAVCPRPPKHPLSQLPKAVQSMVVRQIDRDEEVLYALGGQRCQSRPIKEDLSITPLALAQNPDRSNCQIIAALMAIADHDPAQIPTMIRSVAENRWEVQLFTAQNETQTSTPMLVDKQTLSGVPWKDMYADQTYLWPSVAGHALENTLTAPYQTLAVFEAVYGQHAISYEFPLPNELLDSPPLTQATEIIRLLHLIHSNLGSLDPTNTLNRPAVFGFGAKGQNSHSHQPDIYPFHAYEHLGFDMRNANNPMILVRQTFPLQNTNTTLEARESRKLSICAQDLLPYFKRPGDFLFQSTTIDQSTIRDKQGALR